MFASSRIVVGRLQIDAEGSGPIKCGDRCCPGRSHFHLSPFTFQVLGFAINVAPLSLCSSSRVAIQTDSFHSTSLPPGRSLEFFTHTRYSLIHLGSPSDGGVTTSVPRLLHLRFISPGLTWTSPTNSQPANLQVGAISPRQNRESTSPGLLAQRCSLAALRCAYHTASGRSWSLSI